MIPIDPKGSARRLVAQLSAETNGAAEWRVGTGGLSRRHARRLIHHMHRQSPPSTRIVAAPHLGVIDDPGGGDPVIPCLVVSL